MINRLFSRAGIVDQLSITCGIRLWLARAPISRSSSIGAVVGNPVRTKFPAQCRILRLLQWQAVSVNPLPHHGDSQGSQL
jgi:hypothetical protein